jgi:hypothetical protein
MQRSSLAHKSLLLVISKVALARSPNVSISGEGHPAIRNVSNYETADVLSTVPLKEAGARVVATVGDDTPESNRRSRDHSVDSIRKPLGGKAVRRFLCETGN